MRYKLASVALAGVVALAGGSALAEDTKKKEPTPKSKQELADEAAKKKAAAEKAAAEKAPAEAVPAKPGTDPQAPKAAVNTLEDLFAAYGMAWAPAGADASTLADTAPEPTVVWKDSSATPPVAPKPVPAKAPAGK